MSVNKPAEQLKPDMEIYLFMFLQQIHWDIPVSHHVYNKTHSQLLLKDKQN